MLPRSEPFDFVLLIGVLEYSTSAAGGASGPTAMLETARSFLKPEGVLILAIENQVGLKYLLSHPEDHLGLPWVGLEGYPDSTLPRTWSRPVLASMLTQAGFEDQEWMYPFPDYKLPTFIARDQIFRSIEGRQVLGQFIRQPVTEHAGSGRLVCDSQRAFKVVLDAELGPDTANSFLIAASPTSGAASSVLHEAEAWIASGERLQRFRSQRAIRKVADGYELETTDGPTAAEPAENSWLRNVGHPSELIHFGDCLEDRVLAAVRTDDMHELASALGVFDDFLASNRLEAIESASHPFFLGRAENNLPADFLDCTFKNLIVDGGGNVQFVDREWAAIGNVDEELIRTRAYFELATRIATSGVRNRWNPLMTVGDLVRTLRQVVGDGGSDDLLQRFAVAEEELQRLVAGGSSTSSGEVQAALNTRLHEAIPSFPTLSLIRRLQDLEHLRGENLVLKEEIQSTHHRLEALQDAYRALEDDRREVDEDRQHIYQQLTSARTQCREFDSERAHAQAVRQDLELKLESLRTSRSYRLGRALGAPFRLLR
jgi:hypothetical protein